MKPLEPTFTEKRRELLAKTLMDLLKILIAAALASEFFGKFAMGLRFFLLGLIATLLISGIFICPKYEGER